ETDRDGERRQTYGKRFQMDHDFLPRECNMTRRPVRPVLGKKNARPKAIWQRSDSCAETSR
ncbi:MAG TPA: hypothetical protein VJ924_02565, partial [Alphaproteobacteria bacterium]|nr:hypothetical protein [Alphaproteobacteria bacterium]